MPGRQPRCTAAKSAAGVHSPGLGASGTRLAAWSRPHATDSGGAEAAGDTVGLGGLVAVAAAAAAAAAALDAVGVAGGVVLTLGAGDAGGVALVVVVCAAIDLGAATTTVDSAIMAGLMMVGAGEPERSVKVTSRIVTAVAAIKKRKEICILHVVSTRFSLA